MIAVAQLGARMHYAVPRIIHSAGLLDRFYTDLAISAGDSERLHRLAAWGMPSLGRLASRVIPDVSTDRVTQFRLFGFKYAYDLRRARNASELTRIYLAGGKEFCRLILKHGLGPVAALYAFNSAALELFHRAQDCGILSVLEQTIAPRSIERELLRVEAEQWPDWESGPSYDAYLDDYCDREQREWAAADRIVCGSEFVARTLIATGVPASRCLVVPYGVDAGKVAPIRHASSGKLRILFCGKVGLRKGVPYLLESARLLGGNTFDFRIIGASGLTPGADQALRRVFDWPGSVPRSEVAEHFDWADVFVLPSICEGSATVCYEALAAGLPVITTPNAGSVVRDGVDGYIVPIRDAHAIAARLEQLLVQPELRVEMSRNALSRAKDFTIERYGERLMRAIQQVPSRAH